MKLSVRVDRCMQQDMLTMLTYLIGTGLTFGILLNALLKDNSSPKNHVRSWLVLGVASLLWFVTLPCVIRKKIASARPVPASA